MGSTGPTPRQKVSPADVNNIKSLLSGTNATVLSPEDEGYDKTLKRWSQAAEKPAGVSIVPTSAQDIAKVVKYASEHGLDVAVKGGGHSTAGVSSTDGGILFDLGKITYVDVDVEKKVLKVGGGANWGQVDQAAYKHGLATVGGTVADTGVGGLALGGGYGWLSGLYGLTVDCTLECTVVLANGDVVQANEDVNPDLFWALRGAGQNFGIVTEFVLKAFEVPKEVWAGMLIYAPMPDVLEKVTVAINNLYQVDSSGKVKVNGRGMGGLGVAKPPPAEGKVMMLVPTIFLGSEEEGKEMFKELIDIGPVMSTMAMVPYPIINTILAPPYGLRASMKGAAFELPLRPAFVAQMLEEYQKFTDSSDDLGISMLLWELYDAVKVTELEAGSFSNRGLHLNGMICPIWTKKENDQQCREWAREMNELFKKEQQEHGKKDVGPTQAASVRAKKGAGTMFYGNYDHYDERSKDIFGENYAELQKIKAKYDPGNVFNKLFAITPTA